MIENEYGKFCEVVNPTTNEIIMTAEEYFNGWLENKNKPQEPQSNKIDSLLAENKQLWDTVEYLLKQVDMIPKEI